MFMTASSDGVAIPQQMPPRATDGLSCAVAAAWALNFVHCHRNGTVIATAVSRAAFARHVATLQEIIAGRQV